MADITIDEIKNRIESAVYTMKLLPPAKAQGYRLTKLDIIYTSQELVLMDKKL